MGIQDVGFGPMFAALTAKDAALEPNRRARGHGAFVVNFHVAGHAHYLVRADGLAHGLIEQSGDDAAVHVAARAFIRIGNLRKAYYRTVVGKHEIEMQSGWTFLTAAEASVLRRVWQWGQVFSVCFHCSP